MPDKTWTFKRRERNNVRQRAASSDEKQLRANELTVASCWAASEIGHRSWLKCFEDGREYLSLKFDDPSFAPI